MSLPRQVCWCFDADGIVGGVGGERRRVVAVWPVRQSAVARSVVRSLLLGLVMLPLSFITICGAAVI